MTLWLLIRWHWLWMLLNNRVRPPTPSVLAGLAGDVLRSRSQLILENTLLRQQVIILRRQVARPLLTNTERRWLVMLASQVRQWQQTLLIV